ncbi:MlaD family protein [Gammaproteobacteria bacterium]|nr:MlaD family protein [Gammaproteobacteria bacterium]
METRANFLFVGAFVLLSALALLGFIAWISQSAFDREYRRYELEFSGGITGINQGSAVQFQGVPVGQVIDIGFSTARPGGVLMTIEIGADTPIRSDSAASIQSSGIAGAKFIQLNPGSINAGPPQQSADGIARLPTELSALDQVFADAPNMVTNANNLLHRAERVVSDDNLRSIESTLTHLQTMSARLDQQSVGLLRESESALNGLAQTSLHLASIASKLDQRVASILDNVDAAVGSFDRGIGQFNAIVSENRQPIATLITDFSAAAASVKRLSEETEALVSASSEPLSEFAQAGLYELTLTLREFRDLVTSLKRVSQNLERDPSQLIFGERLDGYEGGKP